MAGEQRAQQHGGRRVSLQTQGGTEWMKPADVAALTGISVGNLKKMRYERRGIPFYKPTLKTVLYDPVEVERFVRATRVDVVR